MVPDVVRYTPSLQLSIGTAGTSRGLKARFNHTIREAQQRIVKFTECADRITLPFSLADLRAVRNDKNTINYLEGRSRQLESGKYPSRAVSAQYFDTDGVPLLFYLAERVYDEPPLKYTLKPATEPGAHQHNFNLQVANRDINYISRARKAFKRIVSDGIAVRLPTSFVPFC
jgi:hypothetical protein